MWDEDQELRDALRTELAERTVPPAHSGLAEVVGLGRRRRRTRQIGATVAAVVAIAGTAVAMSSAGEPATLPPAGTVTSMPTTPPAEADWTRANLPTRTPDTTWTPDPDAPPPAGRPTEPVPQCSHVDIAGHGVESGPLGPDLMRRVGGALRATAAGATVKEVKFKQHGPDTLQYFADVTDANGTGSVTFSAGSFTGDPLTAADQQAFDRFNCDPPKRRVLDDGTVLQLYSPQPFNPYRSLVQVLRIYRPSGEMYTVTAQSFGSPDYGPDPTVPSRLGPGRGSLPLTEGQLTELGVALVS